MTKQELTRTIPVKLFLELWQQLRAREWLDNAGMARKTGIDQSTISAWEIGRVDSVRMSRVKALEEAFHVKITLDGKAWKIDPLGDAGHSNIPRTTVFIHGPEKASDAEKQKWQEKAARIAELLSKASLEDIDRIRKMVEALISE